MNFSNLRNIEQEFAPEMDKSNGIFSPEMEKSNGIFSPEMDKSKMDNQKNRNLNKKDNQIRNSKRTYSKISEDGDNNYYNSSKKIPQNNEFNKKSKSINKSIDIDLTHIDKNLINQNSDQIYYLDERSNNIDDHLTPQLENLNNNRQNNIEKDKLLQPVDIRINEDIKYDTNLFELANKLILIFNKLVDSKAKRKLSLEDKSNISKEIREITEQIYKINKDNVDKIENKGKENDKLENNLSIICTNKNKQNETNKNKKFIQKKLRCTCYVKLEKTDELTKLKRDISELEEFKKGSININYINCDPKGNVKINCETPGGCSNLMKYLESFGHKPYKRITDKFLYCIHGIPLNNKSEDIINELSKRDKRFEDKTLFSINKRFKMDKAHDTVVLQILDPLADEIEKNPIIYLGFKKYKIKKFYNIVQCFKCARFGHTANECKSECDSGYCRGCEKCAKCINCAGSHNLDKCPKNFTPKCINCEREGYVDTNHASKYVVCPVRRKYIEEMKRDDYG